VPSISIRVENGNNRGECLAYLMKVPARRAAVLNVRLAFERRGVYPLPPFDLVSSFPFGLFEQRRRFVDKREVVVYPRVRMVRTSMLRQLPGARHVPRTAAGDGDEFFCLREYIIGDDMRRIVWRISARLGKWVVRELGQEHSRYVSFALDTRVNGSVDGYSELFEEAIELVASLGISLLNRQYHVAVLTPGMSLESGDGTGHERRMLDMLARLEPVSYEDYPEFDGEVRKHESQETTLLCVSPDPALWGSRAGAGGLAVLDPREVLHV
jgi:uncharacterized protein (DUF58 family)